MGKKKHEMNNKQRFACLAMLMGMSNRAPIEQRDLDFVAHQFGTCKKSVARLWQQAKTSRSVGKIDEDEIKNKRHNCSGITKWDRDEVQEAVKELRCKKKKTIRGLAAALGVPKLSVHRLTQLKIIVRKVSYTKPYLTEENKVTRLEYALSLRAGDTVIYQDLYNYIHVDEKWFYLTETGEAYYCAPDEDLPHRTVKSKRFIKKVMFLCAQARPRRLPNGEWWDGKIGIWPIGEVGTAKRASKHRRKGSPV